MYRFFVVQTYIWINVSVHSRMRISPNTATEGLRQGKEAMNRLQEVLENKEKNYILPFFWQHGEEEEVLREYIGAIQDANIGAMCVESRPHPDYVGEKWWKDMDVILDEARKRDMKVWILDDSHFPTGFANGAIKNAPKGLHHKYMCCRTLEMAGPIKMAEFEVKQYMQPATPPWAPAPPKSEDDFADDKLLKILACPVEEGGALGRPFDLTDKTVNGRVVFDLPEGYFKIYVVYITRNGKGRNDYINFLDKDSCRVLIDTVYEAHYDHYKAYFGNVIAGFFSDEPPIGNVPGYMPIGPIGTAGQDLPWSDRAMSAFDEEYGSEGWREVLPYLWADAQDKAEQAKVRNAYMQMVTKLVEECFSNQIGQWCQEHGVEYIGHMLEDCDMNMNLGASMGHFFRGLAGQHMAGVDNIGGQVTIAGENAVRHDNPACRDEAGFYHYMLGKMGASHGAIDPKKKGRTMCENFGAYGWQSGPREEKFMMDHFMVRGVNRYVPHAFTPAPFPDPDCPPHFYAHGENPTYRAFGELMAYSNRVCHLIDGGTPCMDVALLYAAEGVWAGGGESDIPICRALCREQVDFHILPADVFVKDGEYSTEFDGSRLLVNGITYRALVIPGCRYLDVHTAAFVKEAIRSDFPIIFTDYRPEGITGALEKENSDFIQQISICPVVPAQKVGSYIRENEIVPLQISLHPAQPRITGYHYVLEGRDELLLLNEMPAQYYEGEVKVRAKGLPVRYYPWENRLEEVTYTDIAEGEISIQLLVAPLELCILLFMEKEEAEKALANAGKALSGVLLKERRPAAFLQEFSVGRVEAKAYLRQLREHGAALHGADAMVPFTIEKTVKAPFTGMQEEFPDYAGYYIYETKVSLSPEKGYVLEIEQVNESAEVFVNGKSMGMRLQAPYVYEIPAACLQRDGENTIRIEAATLPERKVKAMGVNISAMSADRPLSPTGILGEVKIYEKR